MLPLSLPTFYSFLQGRIPGYLDEGQPFGVRPAVWLRREGCFHKGNRDHHLPLETWKFRQDDIDGAVKGVQHNGAKNECPGRRRGSAGRTGTGDRGTDPKALALAGPRMACGTIRIGSMRGPGCGGFGDRRRETSDHGRKSRDMCAGASGESRGAPGRPPRRVGIDRGRRG